MNLINIFQQMIGGNPQQLVQQMSNPKQLVQQVMSNPKIVNNPIAKNMFDMAQKGDTQGVESIGRNVAKERGIDFDKAFNQFKNQFGIK